MRMMYSPEVVDFIEDTEHSEVSRAIRELVAGGFLGYHVESNGVGGVRLRYFALHPRVPSTPGLSSDKEIVS